MGAINDKLKSLGIEIPPPAPPAANYVPYCISGNLIFVSGQLPMASGAVVYSGKLGADVSEQDGVDAAKLCAVNIIAQLEAATGGDLDRITRIVKLGGFVNAIPEFTDHPKIINGASNFFLEVFGEIGKHSRFAMGAGSLPLNVAVEIEAIAEFK